MQNIPEPLWNTTLLVKSRKLFERWLADPDNVDCPMFVISSLEGGKEVPALTKAEIKRLLDAGFKQMRIGNNCILY